MSTDYHLICRECKKQLSTVASGSIAYGDKLWASPEALKKLQDFLFAHQKHPMVFLSEHAAEDEELDANEGFDEM